MSASLASARMNSRQPCGSAWIAASLRSSDLIISVRPSAVAVAKPGDRHSRACRRRRCRRRRPSSPGRRPWPSRCSAGRGPALADDRPCRRPSGLRLEHLVDRLAEHLRRVLERRTLLRARGRSRAAPRRPTGRRPSAPRGRRRACRTWPLTSDDTGRIRLRVERDRVDDLADRQARRRTPRPP